MKINGTTPRPIPPSGITRISLWRHGMDRPQMVSTEIFRQEVGRILDGNGPLYQKTNNSTKREIVCFNMSFQSDLAGFGYILSSQGNHNNILFPDLKDDPFRCLTYPSLTQDPKTWIALSPTDPDLLLEGKEDELFTNFVTAGRFLAENNFSANTIIAQGTINDLMILNNQSGNSLFNGSIKTLADLAAQALPQDAKPDNVLPFPRPITFDHSENHPGKKCSFGFNIIHPEKFPYNAPMVTSAIRAFLSSYGWDQQRLDMALEPLDLPFKDGERVIHIISRNISKDRTEMNFCIRKPLEYEGNAPIRGQIVFRK